MSWGFSLPDALQHVERGFRIAEDMRDSLKEISVAVTYLANSMEEGEGEDS